MLEVVAGISAVLAIAGAAAKISKTLYGVARDAGSARDDIETWACTFASFSSVVQTAYMSLRDHLEARAQSLVINYIKENHVLELVMKHAKCIKRQITKVQPYVREISSSTTLFTILKWLLRKSEVEALGPKMECVKSSLTTLLQVISLEILKEAEPTKKTAKLIAQLQEQIKVQTKTIATLEKQQHRKHSQFSVDTTEALTSIDEVAYNALINLAKSMAQRGTVPTYSYKSNPPSAAHRTANHKPAPNFPVGGPVERKENTPPKQVINPRQPQDHLKQPAVIQSESRSQNDVPAESSNAIIPLLSSQLPKSANERATQLDSMGEGEPEVVKQVQVEISRDEKTIESDYQNVRPNEYLRDLDPLNTESSTDGYISIGSVLTFVTANVDSSLRENLMSQNLAVQLDLDIRPIDSSPDEDDLNWIILKDGQKIRKVGETEFQWTKGNSSHRRPFTVACWVYEYNQRPLVFGQPFLETRRRRWSYARDGTDIDQHSSESMIGHKVQKVEAHTTGSSSRTEGSVHRPRRSSRRSSPS